MRIFILFVLIFCIFHTALASGGVDRVMLDSGELKNQSKHALSMLSGRLLTLPVDLYQRAGHLVGLNPLDKLTRRNKKDGTVFNVLSVIQNNRAPIEKNSLAFYNDHNEWDYLAPRDIGYCRGLAHVGMMYNNQAIFEGELASKDLETLKNHRKHKYLRGIPRINENRDAYIKYHVKLGLDLFRGKIRVIPEFNNLFEYTSDPVIQEALKQLTIKIWSKNSIKFDTIGMVYRMHKQAHPSVENINEFLTMLQRNFDLGFNGKIFFSLDITNVPQENQIELPRIARLISPGHKKRVGPFVIHVVEAYDMVELDEDTVSVKIWDRNFEARRSDELIINQKTGEIFYPTWAKIEKYSYAEGMISDIGFTVEHEYMLKRTYREWHRFRKIFPQVYHNLVISRK